MASPAHSVTQLLNAWSSGDEDAGRKLVEIVYQDLRRLASHYMQNERANHTLQPTALVHELYLKFFSSDPIEWRNRGHFLAVAAKQLRNLIVDYARSQRAQKRGGNDNRIALGDAPDRAIALDERVLDLDEALERLSKLDERSALVVELLYFGGLTHIEIANTLAISVATVKRDWEFARVWLLKDMASHHIH
jgi:RNA polymerase sigma factor (TIGR02999 family)